MTEDKTVAVKLTKAELWELMNNFSASFDTSSGRSSTGALLDDDNSIAERVSAKLNAAYRRLA